MKVDEAKEVFQDHSEWKSVVSLPTPWEAGVTLYRMQNPEQEDHDEGTRSRPTSRRNSASLSRRSSAKKDKEGKKKSPLNTAPSSANSTPKKQVKQPLDLCVTGKQILKKCDRANSLPMYQRRPSAESARRRGEARLISVSYTGQPKSRDTSLEDDLSLDLSQVSDFEDRSSKYGTQKKMTTFATSTPKSVPKQKPRSASMQSQMHLQQKMESAKRVQVSARSNSTFCSGDSLYKTSSSASNYRTGLSTDLDYSSVSPEYSGQSSTDLSPRNIRDRDMSVSPRSQEINVSSCCMSSWQECSSATKVEEYRDSGEWTNFWANYNNSVGKVPVKSYYDQCPTPYRTEDINLVDLDFSTASSRKRSPDNVRNINNIIRNEGLHLTPRETQNIIKCAHILGNVLTKAIERRSKEKDSENEEEKIQELVEEKKEETTNDQAEQGGIITQPLPDIKEIKKKTMTLDLKETVMPLEVKVEVRQETVMTQTDISLPNTKSAPRIFEKILRQLSRSSLEESIGKSLSMEKRMETVEKEKEEVSEKKEEPVEIKTNSEVSAEASDKT